MTRTTPAKALTSKVTAKRADKAAAPNGVPEKFTYRLATFAAERRTTGWFIAKTEPEFAGTKPEWHGPFKTIETAALAIARRHATEIADRHTRSIEHHKLDKTHNLYGLKPSTAL